MTRVLVADDFPLVRDGFAAALERDPHITVVGVAVDGADTLDRVAALAPDVVVLDLDMPRMSGLTVLARLTAEHPAVRVLVISDETHDADAVHAVAAGAAGLLAGHVGGHELCEAVHTVARGDVAIAPDLLRTLMSGVRDAFDAQRTQATTQVLTVSELEVLRLVARGRTDMQIGQSMLISPRRVQSHLARIRAKAGVSRRTQLARWASEHAMI